MAWEAISWGYAFLAVTGLIYPANLKTAPLYAQFTSLPSARSWPHREGAQPEDTYHLYPGSPIENPVENPSPFAPGSLPAIFVAPGQHASASAITMGLWRQIAAGQFDSQNRDLDADRGFGHPCWKAGKSVHDDPVDVVILQYERQ